MTAGELAEESGLTPGAITTVLDRMERGGYANRVADPTDRRRVLVTSTAATRELGARVWGEVELASRARLTELDDAGVTTIRDYIRGVREFYEAAGAGGGRPGGRGRRRGGRRADLRRAARRGHASAASSSPRALRR